MPSTIGREGHSTLWTLRDVLKGHRAAQQREICQAVRRAVEPYLKTAAPRLVRRIATPPVQRTATTIMPWLLLAFATA